MKTNTMKKSCWSFGLILSMGIHSIEIPDLYMTPSERLMLAAVQGSKDCLIARLVHKRADPNFQPLVGGCTPLHEAASYGNEEEVKELLLVGAKVNVRALNSDWTALTFAKKRWKSEKNDAYTRIIQTLEAVGGTE